MMWFIWFTSTYFARRMMIYIIRRKWLFAGSTSGKARSMSTKPSWLLVIWLCGRNTFTLDIFVVSFHYGGSTSLVHSMILYTGEIKKGYKFAVKEHSEKFHRINLMEIEAERKFGDYERIYDDLCDFLEVHIWIIFNMLLTTISPPCKNSSFIFISVNKRSIYSAIHDERQCISQYEFRRGRKNSRNTMEIEV